MTAGRTDVRVHLARRFADPSRSDTWSQFNGLTWSSDPLTDAPLLEGSVAHMACDALQSHQIGDHVLVLAEVIGGQAGEGTPLLNYAGELQIASFDYPIAAATS